MTMKRILLLLCLSGLGVFAAAQDIVDICGEYTYYPSEDVTLAQAKQTALQRARLEGLIREFNETVYQSNTSVVSNRNGESNIDIYSIGGSDARGEWIEDTNEPEYEVFYEQEMLVVNVKVCGKAREVKSASVAVDAKVLRNGTLPKYESGEFNAGDDMYLYFRSPVAGYVLVYLLDRASQTVYCLLPYRDSQQGNVQVRADKDYVFFHRDKRYNNWQEIDEYTLTAENPVEWNDIYILFSPHPFYKAASNTPSSEYAPKELPFKDFEKWLVRCRTKDPELVVEKRQVKITK